MTPEEQQTIQQDLDTLKAHRKEHQQIYQNIRLAKLSINDGIYPPLSAADKAIYTEVMQQEQQRLDNLDQKLLTDFKIVRGGSEYNIDKAIAEREQQLGIPPQERQPKPELTTILPEWKQTADQRAGQPLETHELVKKMDDIDKFVRESKQIQEEVARNSALKLSEIGKQYLENQRQAAAQEFMRMAKEHTEAFQQWRQTPSTHRELTFENLQTRVREINSEALHAKFREAEVRQREQTRTQTKTKDR